MFQIMEFGVRELALFAAIGFLVGGISDILVDLGWFGVMTRRLFNPGGLRKTELDSLPTSRNPGKLAIFIPAWDEADVIARMLDFATLNFAGQDYRLFVGTYPNDPETIEAVRSVCRRAANVKLVIGSRSGPTTKADCLNWLWDALLEDEIQTGRKFKAVILHDAEDLVHPSELMLFDRMIDAHAMVQIPVQPLIDRNSRWIGGHYCDEFAESHGKDLIVRDAIGAGVPSAGVGCAIARDMLAEIAADREGRPFDADSLTEDYELGLRVAERGGQGVFARIYDSQDDGHPLICVRGHFPGSIRSSVRQKTRWVRGIALAGWDRMGWHGGICERWMRLRDRWAILAALILAVAYLALVLGTVLLAWSLFSTHSLSPVSATFALLLKINFGLLVWRLALRGFFTGYAYGWREGLLAVPRAVVSNVIAIMAARRAVTGYLFTKQGTRVIWDKTTHVFPERAHS